MTQLQTTADVGAERERKKKKNIFEEEGSERAKGKRRRSPATGRALNSEMLAANVTSRRPKHVLCYVALSRACIGPRC